MTRPDDPDYQPRLHARPIAGPRRIMGYDCLLFLASPFAWFDEPGLYLSTINARTGAAADRRVIPLPKWVRGHRVEVFALAKAVLLLSGGAIAFRCLG